MKHLIAIYAEVCGTPTLKFKALKAKTKRAAEIYMRAEQETQAPLLIATRDELLAIVQKTIGGKAAAVDLTFRTESYPMVAQEDTFCFEFASEQEPDPCDFDDASNPKAVITFHGNSMLFFSRDIYGAVGFAKEMKKLEAAFRLDREGEKARFNQWITEPRIPDHQLYVTYGEAQGTYTLELAHIDGENAQAHVGTAEDCPMQKLVESYRALADAAADETYRTNKDKVALALEMVSRSDERLNNLPASSPERAALEAEARKAIKAGRKENSKPIKR